jgi:transcriptional regulator with GAF, ATPase, and Fis domain
MADVIHLIERVAPSDTSVLITGESGTGKELVAQAVHRLESRERAFIDLNCAAFQESLLESELSVTKRARSPARRDASSV